MNKFDIISDTVIGMLEESAFIFSDPVDEITVTKDMKSKMLGYCIKYTSPKSGTIAVFADKEVATMIAANMTGLEEDDPMAEEEAGNALQEFTNIIAGHIITELHGTELVFDLGIPEAITGGLPNDDNLIQIEIDVEDYKLILEFIEP